MLDFIKGTSSIESAQVKYNLDDVFCKEVWAVQHADIRIMDRPVVQFIQQFLEPKL